MLRHNNLDFLQESHDLDPVSFFRWKGYETQDDKQSAHSAYISLIHTAKSLPKCRQIGERMEEHWKQCQKGPSLTNFWCLLPKSSSTAPQRQQPSTSILTRLRTQHLLANVKRLHRRDNELSEVLDGGLVSAAKLSVEGAIVASTTPPGSPSHILSNNVSESRSPLSGVSDTNSIAPSSLTATISHSTSTLCGGSTAPLRTLLDDMESCRSKTLTRFPSASVAQPSTSETSSSGSLASSSASASTSSSPATSSLSDISSSSSAPAIVDESEQLLDREREELLRSVDESGHPLCDWKIDNACAACLFAEYRRACIKALNAHEIKRTDIADIMAIIGVFSPSMPTNRMHKFFSAPQLTSILEPRGDLPDLDIDDTKMMKAVRLYLRNKGDEAEVPSVGENKKTRIMLETLLEYLPLKTDNTVSESTFTVKYVAPIVQAYVDSDRITSDFPNTDSLTQRQQNLKADRPDIRAKANGQELLWGEVTGPIQAGNNAKNLWDTYKLARYGKAFITAGNDSAPLVQVINDHGTYMRLYLKVRGVMILEEVGTFVIPTRKAMVPALVATLPTLEILKEHMKKMGSGKSNQLKRSWGHQDVKDVKKRLI